jgi:hypothetical protein
MLRAVSSLVFLALLLQAQAQEIEPMYRLHLTNTASGGTLTLTKTPMWPYPYVSIGTSEGESATVVLARLAAALNDCDACDEYFSYSGSISAEEHSLVMPADAVFGPNEFIFATNAAPCGSHVLGGTEHGLGIPVSPSALSARKVSTHEVMLDWINGDNDYDNIAVVVNTMTWAILPGDATWFVHDLQGLKPVGLPQQSTNDLVYYIVACRRGTPSNGAGIRLREGRKQESVMATPFSGGLCPTFESWSLPKTNGSIGYVEGRRSGVYPNTDIEAQGTQAFYQTINGNGDVIGGVWRQFLLLPPGKYYEVAARINTLQMGQGDWTLSFHAASGPEDGGSLSLSQMAGQAPLPDGSSGSSAARIACFDASNNTEGAWVIKSTSGDGFGKEVGNVLIPTNSLGSLTVWFRLSGSNLSAAVAVDLVTVEEAANP